METIEKSEIADLLMKLGSNLPDDFTWSNELRSDFERIIKYLQSNAK